MLQFPSTHKPRYNDFPIKPSSHGTIRDAGERAPSSASNDDKLELCMKGVGATELRSGRHERLSP